MSKPDIEISEYDSPLQNRDCHHNRESLYTTTSSSTQWGPGATAGKAILAMGKAVLRGAEHLLILRRLAAIKALLPCADYINGIQSDAALEKAFADLLVLARPGLYPEDVRIQVMQIIVAQIATEQTRHLRLSIAKWEIDWEELDAFLSELVAVALFSNRGCCEERLADIYTTALPSDLHPWSAFIAFLSELAQLNEHTFQLAVNAQLLEILIWVSGRQIKSRTDDTRVEAYCNVAFAVLSTPPFHAQNDLWANRVSAYCPTNPPTSLAQLVQQISEQEQWLAVERRLLEKHVHAMLGALSRESTREPDFGGIYNFQPCVPRLADAPPSLPSIRNLMWCVGIGGDAHKETMEYLAPLSHQRKVLVLDQLMRDLTIQFIVEPPTPYSLLTQTPEFIAHVVEFFMGISEHSDSIGEAVLDAALLNLLPFLAQPSNPQQIYDDVCRRAREYGPLGHFGHKSRSCYSAATTSFLNAIQSGGFEAVFDAALVRNEVRINLQHLLEPIITRTSAVA
ncbi:hypothetical protein C8R43DRAFT_947754 [Mycena crocata]|nr:hypothetical protein C8R43DRAFT_947754 [Mycena crocata]